MRNHYIKKLVLWSTLLFTSLHILEAQWPIMKEDADSLTHQGLNYIYDVQFDKAEKCFDKIKQRYPEHPVGYFLDALTEWWYVSLYRETEDYDKIFIEKIDKVIEVCNETLDKNPGDLIALFFKGGAIGYKGRLYSLRYDWLGAATAGSQAQDILNKCLMIAENNYDIMLGTGLYNYFAEVLPKEYPMLEPLMSFVQKGNKQIGLLQLKAAASKSKYSNIEAKVVLLQIYYHYENNTQEALRLAKELHQEYPDNPYFYKYLGRCYVKNYDIELWEKSWRDILIRFIQKKTGYENYTAREACYYIGAVLMNKSQNKMALKYFKKCEEASKILDNERPSGFWVKAAIKSANLLDLLGRRSEAIKKYKEVLAMNDYDNSHSEASRYLKTPFGK
jgi:tetratricopeptide (TPR) repeat protein